VGPFQLGGKLPFDKLRANGQAFSFALSREPVERSKGEFAPKLKYAPVHVSFDKSVDVSTLGTPPSAGAGIIPGKSALF
jgi:hypothetical protein